MSRRNTISREFFATIAAVLVLGLSVMCAIQAALSAAYFIGERKSSLTDVLNGATALSERFADEGSIVTKPLQGEDVLARSHTAMLTGDQIEEGLATYDFNNLPTHWTDMKVF